MKNWLKWFRRPRQLCANLEAELEQEQKIEFTTERDASIYQLKQDFVHILKKVRRDALQTIEAGSTELPPARPAATTQGSPLLYV